MSNDGSTDSPASDEFGANGWLVEEMYESWVKDPGSVDASWIPTLQQYAARLGATVVAPAAPAPVTPKITG